MTPIRVTTIRAIHDALAMRGPDASGGFIRTAAPSDYMSAERLRLALAVAEHLPRGATPRDANDLAERLEPVIRASLALPAAAT